MRMMQMEGRVLLAVLLFLGIALAGQAQQPELKFKRDSTFKIAQFTDLHLKYEDPRSAITYERIREVVEAEKPDFIILTGDIIFGPPAKENFEQILAFLSEFKIPFSFVFGNHDDEHQLSREELFELGKKYTYNLTADEPGLSGVGNYVLPVQSCGNKTTAALLYGIDSHSYSKIPGVSGYDYIKHDQIDWYRQTSAQYNASHEVPLPALAFFHIPLPEYAEAVVNQRAQLYGIRREPACNPVLNSGLFTAFKEQGDVMGTFVGHDHDNDYAVAWQGILLAYGRYTGGNTVYNNLPNGARLIELKEGSHTFATWIRTAAGVEQKTAFPADYTKK